MAHVSPKPKAVLWVVSPHGHGHYNVAFQMAEALKPDFDVTILTEQMKGTALRPPEGVTLSAELPPLKDGEEAYREELEAILGEMKLKTGDAFITEMWPVGRREYDGVLQPVLRELNYRRERPKLFSLVRDVVFENREHPDHPAEAGVKKAELVKNGLLFDRILVRGDGRIQLPDIRSLVGILAHKLDYTGYFVSDLPTRDASIPDAEREILVTSGGDWTPDARKLLFTAVEAAGMLQDMPGGSAHHPWRILVPRSIPEETLETLQAKAAASGASILIERQNGDFRKRLANAHRFVSMGGYNSVMESLKVGVGSVFIAQENQVHDDHNEQAYRLEMFARQDLVKSISARDLDPWALAVNLREEPALDPTQLEGMFSGAKNAANIIVETRRNPVYNPGR